MHTADSPRPDVVAWVEQTRKGDPRGFRRLMEHTAPWVLANCRHLSGSAEDGRDLSQEVFVKAFFRLDGLREPAAFEGWLKRIKVNHCISYVRRRRLRHEVEEAYESDSWTERSVPPWDPEEIDAERDREFIGEVLEQMRDTLRIPLVMHDMDEYSYSEIAEELSIGVSAVKMRIHRARHEFRERFEELRGRVHVAERSVG